MGPACCHQDVLIPPANAGLRRARSSGGNEHDRASSTSGTGPAAPAAPGPQLWRPRQPASSAWIKRKRAWKSGRMGGRRGRPKADSDEGGWERGGEGEKGGVKGESGG